MNPLPERLLAVAGRFSRDYCPMHRALSDRLRAAAGGGVALDQLQAQWTGLVREILTSSRWLELLFPDQCKAAPELAQSARLAAIQRHLPDAEAPDPDFDLWIAEQADVQAPGSLMGLLLDDLATLDHQSPPLFLFLSRYYLFLDLLCAHLVDVRLKPLHRLIFSHYHWQRRHWPNGYVADYPYQGMSRLGISGIKPTEERLARYALEGFLRPTDTVLDIGCNNGFLSLAVAGQVGHVTGIEFNPYLVCVAEAARRFLGVGNALFQVADFVEYEADTTFDVVFSLANHCTIDGNLSMDFEGYISKVFSLLKPGGLLLFESHNVFGPGRGGPGDDGDLDAKFDIAERYFEVIKSRMTTAYVPPGPDVDKLFVILRRREAYTPGASRTFRLAEARQRYAY